MVIVCTGHTHKAKLIWYSIRTLGLELIHVGSQPTYTTYYALVRVINPAVAAMLYLIGISAAEYRRHLTSTKLYCLVADVHV